MLVTSRLAVLSNKDDGLRAPFSMLHGDAAASLICKAAILACGLAIVIVLKLIFSIARRSAILSRQFSGPPPTSLLLGALHGLI